MNPGEEPLHFQSLRMKRRVSNLCIVFLLSFKPYSVGYGSYGVPGDIGYDNFGYIDSLFPSFELCD